MTQKASGGKESNMYKIQVPTKSKMIGLLGQFVLPVF